MGGREEGEEGGCTGDIWRTQHNGAEIWILLVCRIARTHICMYNSVCTHTCICMYICSACTHTHMYTHTDTHSYTPTPKTPQFISLSCDDGTS